MALMHTHILYSIINHPSAGTDRENKYWQIHLLARGAHALDPGPDLARAGRRACGAMERQS